MSILQAGAQIYEGISAYQEGAAEKKMSDYNAALEEQKAKQIEAVTGLKQQRQAELASREASTMEVGVAVSGAVSTQGSPLLMQAKQASESELENLMIGYGGGVQAAQARSQAAIDRMTGKLAKWRGKAKMIGSFMGAGGTMLAGFGGPTAAKTTPPGPGTIGTQGPTEMGW
jgi:hypothetical protein